MSVRWPCSQAPLALGSSASLSMLFTILVLQYMTHLWCFSLCVSAAVGETVLGEEATFTLHTTGELPYVDRSPPGGVLICMRAPDLWSLAKKALS